jgi:hypothetical protein
MRELNLFKHCGNEIVDDLHRQHDMALVYWRKNRRQYPLERVWDKYYFDLLCKSFESRHELRACCEAREKQMKDLMYLEEQRQQQMKAEEEKRLAQEGEQHRRRETLDTWEHNFVKQEEANRHAREADLGGTTSEIWPPPRSPSGNFPSSFFQNLTIHYNSYLKGIMSAFVILFLL